MLGIEVCEVVGDFELADARRQAMPTSQVPRVPHAFAGKTHSCPLPQSRAEEHDEAVVYMYGNNGARR